MGNGLKAAAGKGRSGQYSRCRCVSISRL